MKIPSLNKISKRFPKPSPLDRLGDKFEGINHDHPFLPESFTLLYHTDFYGRLTAEQQLYYNQLCGAMTNELSMFLEQELINKVLIRLLHHPKIVAIEDFRVCLLNMIGDEKEHGGMFEKLNQLCFPELYQHSSFHFIRFGFRERLGFRLCLQFPAQLTFVIWLLLIIEEYSMTLSTAVLKDHGNGRLGPVDGLIRAIHEKHLQDEVGHVFIDIHLLRTFFETSAPWAKKVNLALLKAVFREMTTPKRANRQVIRQLVRVFPELKPMEEDMIRAMIGLKDDQVFQRDFFSRETLPRTFQLFDEYFEATDLIDTFPAIDQARPHASNPGKIVLADNY